MSLDQIQEILNNSDQIHPDDLIELQMRARKLVSQSEAYDVIQVSTAVKNLDAHWMPVFDRFRRNYAMTYGDQLSAEEKAVMRNAKPARPETIHNKILPKVMQFAGAFIKNRRTVAAYPVDQKSDPQTAEAVTKYFRHTERDNDLDYVHFQVALSGFITRIGWYYMPPPPVNATDEQLLVKIKFEDAELIEVDPDAHDIRDQKTWKLVCHSSWLSYSEIANLYPDKAKSIKDSLNPDGTANNLAIDRLSIGTLPSEDISSLNSISDTGSSFTQMPMQFMFNTLSGLYRVCALWERKVRDETDEYGNSERKEYMHVRVLLPYLNMMLGVFDLPYTSYPFFPNVPLDLGGSIIDRQSPVDQMIPLQQERNRLFALWNKITRRALAKTVILAHGEGDLKKEMIDRKDEAGIYEAHTPAGANPVHAILDPAVQLGEIERLLQYNDKDFDEIALVVPAVAGESENASESGEYYNAKLAQGEQQLTPLFFSNLKTVIPMLYRAIIERYQLYYTKPMTLRILGEEIGQFDDVSVNQYDPITDKILNDMTMGKYDIQIDDVAFGNNRQEEQARLISNVMGMIPPGTPPQVIGLLLSEFVGNLRLENRQALSEYIRTYFGVNQPPLMLGSPPAQGMVQGGDMPRQM
jgi:hypothetical protein